MKQIDLILPFDWTAVKSKQEHLFPFPDLILEEEPIHNFNYYLRTKLILMAEHWVSAAAIQLFVQEPPERKMSLFSLFPPALYVQAAASALS